MFTGENETINEENFECIPRMVNHEQNDRLISNPTMVVLKEVVFFMNPLSAVGTDGINGFLLKKCCHIINQDLMELIKEFFSGQ